MEHINRNISIFLCTAIMLFISAWSFNNFNPWVGIAIPIAYIWIAINIFKTKNKQEKK